MQTIGSWRHNKTWAKQLGQCGRVVAATIVRVAADEQVAFSPYPYLLVDFPIGRKAVIGVQGESFKIGDQVKLVLRKLSREGAEEIISYGLKAEKVNEKS